MIAVTGASGFLGAAITKLLGDDVVTIGRSPTGAAAHITADLTDAAAAEAVAAELQGKQITHLVHLAGVTPWSGQPDFGQDLQMAQTVVRICQTCRIQRLVFLSGWVVYGAGSSVPISETEAVDPASPYGKSKAAVETYLVRNLTGTTVLSLRVSSVYGPGQTSPGLLPNLVHMALADRMVKVSAKTTRRDYLYIDDLTAAMQKLVALDDFPEGVLNIGSGGSVSVEEAAQTVARICGERTGSTIPVVYDEALHEAEQPDNRLDITKAQALGLLERITPFRTGIAAYADWRMHENIL